MRQLSSKNKMEPFWVHTAVFRRLPFANDGDCFGHDQFTTLLYKMCPFLPRKTNLVYNFIFVFISNRHCIQPMVMGCLR